MTSNQTSSTSATDNTAENALSARKLTDTELERLAYGMVGQILQNFIDNGEEIDMDEWLPEDLQHEILPPIIYEQIGEQILTLCNNMQEEAAKRDA